MTSQNHIGRYEPVPTGNGFEEPAVVETGPETGLTPRASISLSSTPSSLPSTPRGSLEIHTESTESGPDITQPTKSSGAFPTRKAILSPAGWLWELSSILLAIGCIGAIIGVLIYIDAMFIEDWRFLISPNSLIAIMTTILKTTMLFTVATCIGQLKWTHFSTRPRPVSDIELFDDASRGPWGSFMFVANMRAEAITTSLLAIVTILSLGLEPSVQQILELSVRQKQLTNATVSMPVSTNYHTSAFGRISTMDVYSEEVFNMTYNKILAEHQLNILNGALGNVPNISFVCPEQAAECRWTNFTTLGVCGNAKDVTKEVVPDCKTTRRKNDWFGMDDIEECTFDFSDVRKSSILGPSLSIPISKDGPDPRSFPKPINMTWIDGLETKFNYMTAIGSLGMRRGGGSLDIVRYIIPDPFIGTQRSMAKEAWSMELYWCAHVYDEVVASPVRIKHEKKKHFRLDRVPGQIGKWPSEFEQGIYRGVIRAPDYFVYEDEMNRTYTIDEAGDSDTAIFRYVMDSFSNALTYGNFPTTVSTSNESGVITIDVGDDRMGDIEDQNADKAIELSRYLYSTDPQTLAENMARTLTLQVRQGPGNGGDNADPSTVGFPGEAFYMASCYKVRWGWLTFALVEVISATALLVLAIAFTLREPLLKNSQIALMDYSAAGLGGKPPGTEQGEPNTGAKREGQGWPTGMTIQLREKMEGGMAFERDT